jgi:NAD(P)-dependent dehydrogenase (short-subunit alcohol dehydrogenase family)
VYWTPWHTADHFTRICADLVAATDSSRANISAMKSTNTWTFAARRRLGSTTEANFDDTRNVNVRAVQKTLPLMRDGGSIITTGSIASALPGFERLQREQGGHPLFRAHLDDWPQGSAHPGECDQPGHHRHRRVHRRSKRGQGSVRLDRPDGMHRPAAKIATVAHFLASGDSSFVTGIETFVAGGTAQI